MALRFLIISDLELSAAALQHSLCFALADVEEIQIWICTEENIPDQTECTVDLVMVDLWLPLPDDLEWLAQLRRRWEKTPILVVSSIIDNNLPLVAEDYRLAGVLAKSQGIGAVAEGIRTILCGEGHQLAVRERTNLARPVPVEPRWSRFASLTPHQRLVLKLICRGLLNKQIAYRLAIKETTVKAHIRDIFRRLRLSSRVEAMIEVIRLNIEGLAPQQAADDMALLLDKRMGDEKSA